MTQEITAVPQLSTTVQQMAPSGIRRFFDIAAKMEDIVSLGVGEPDFTTPWTVREAAIYSLERGQTTYTSNSGLWELRQAIASHIYSLYRVVYHPEDEILVTVGVSEGLDLALRAILNPGEEVLVPEPCYVSYKPCVALAGGKPVGVPTLAGNQFRPTVKDLEKYYSSNTKAILLGFPSNPTGSTMPREQVQAIVDFALKRNLFIISDEIYDRLVYDGEHVCLGSFEEAKDRTIVLNGFSKAYAMTGWRIGYALAAPRILSAMVKIHAYTALCAPITGQKAAVEALLHGEQAVQDMVEQYGQRRRLIVDGLNELGLQCHLPQGAFYAFPSIESTGLSAEDFCERLLFDQHVAVVPGTAFGAGGEGHIRCSYATSINNIQTALVRMQRFLDKLRAGS